MSTKASRKLLRKLLRRRRQLAALLPLASQGKQGELRREIAKIDMQLGKEASFSTDRRSKGAQFPVSASGVDGVGPLIFSAKAPPGQKRLVRLPFYLYEVEPQSQGTLNGFVPANALWITAGGNQAPGAGNGQESTNPTVIVNIPNQTPDGTNINNTAWTGKIVGLKFRTPQIEWADLQVVGFTVEQRESPFVGASESAGIPSPVPGVPQPNYVTATGQYSSANYFKTPGAHLYVTNLAVGGGANLFMQQGFADANIYDSRIPEFAGLRAYPHLESPNRAYVEAAVQGAPETSLTFSLALICEDLRDTQYGSGIPGPYVRRDAMLRETNQAGDAFVSD